MSITEPETRAYEPVIGIEIHVQLSTRTKMFCGCALAFGAEPNTLTCPVCLGHPGTLPVTNAEAVHFALMIAMAFDCEIAPRSIFHRKNYFYPDLPKGYQISQYDIPLATGGRLGDVRIHRVHLEEDAAKLVHAGSSGRIHGAETSVVDFNRGGTPLVEIVTEPDLRSPAQAAEFGRAAAGDAAADGRVGREHGGGVAAGRRQRVDPAGWRDDARHQGRAQEHELVPLPRARHRGRDRAPGGDPPRGRQGRAGDAPLRPAQRHAQRAPLEGGGARLPLLPGARPGPDRADRGDARARAGGDAGAAGRPGRALRARARAAPRDGAAARLPLGARRLLRGGAERVRQRRLARARQLDHERAGREGRRRRPGVHAARAGRAGPARRDGRARSRCPPRPPRRCSTCSSPRAASRPP